MVNLSPFHVRCVWSYIIKKKPQNLKILCDGKDAGWPRGWIWETLSGFLVPVDEMSVWKSNWRAGLLGSSRPRTILKVARILVLT